MPTLPSPTLSLRTLERKPRWTVSVSAILMSSYRVCTPNVVSIGRPASGAVERARGVGAGHHAVVMLVELVAEHGIVKEIGEVVEEIELALDDIGIGPPRPRIVGPRDARRQREAVGVAAVARIFRAETVRSAGAIARSGTWSVEFHLLE